MTVTAAQLLEEARLTIPEISATDVHDKLQQTEVAAIIDVREPAEWQNGHVPGAIHVLRGLLEWMADPTYANHEPRLTDCSDKARRHVRQRRPLPPGCQHPAQRGLSRHCFDGWRLQ